MPKLIFNALILAEERSMMPARIIRGRESWFARKRQEEEVRQIIKGDVVDARKLEEASRLADRIEEVIKPYVMKIAEKHGEVIFHSSMGLNHDVADRLSTSELVDKILETAGEDAEKKWVDKPMRFMALITVLQERL